MNSVFIQNTFLRRAVITQMKAKKRCVTMCIVTNELANCPCMRAKGITIFSLSYKSNHHHNHHHNTISLITTRKRSEMGMASHSTG